MARTYLDTGHAWELPVTLADCRCIRFDGEVEREVEKTM